MAVIRKPPEQINPFELFPGLDAEFEEKIAHAEQRIKNWVLIGIMSNAIALALAAIPCIFYLGTVSQTATESLNIIQQQRMDIIENQRAIQRRVNWEVAAEQWMITKGFHPPATDGRN